MKTNEMLKKYALTPEHINALLADEQEYSDDAIERTIQEKNKTLAKNHWLYIGELLNVTLKKGIYTKDDVIENCRFHYLTAWEHGAKHFAELLDGRYSHDS